MIATRPTFLLLAVVAVGIGLATAQTSGLTLDPLWAALTLAGAVSLHAAANVHNDLADDLNGSDAANQDRQFPFTGGSRMIQSGVTTPQATQWLARWLYALTIGIGLILLIPGGWPLLALGALGLLMAWAYSAPTISLNARGLGEIAVGIGFGILMPLGADAVQRGELHNLPMFAGAGFALMTSRETLHDSMAPLAGGFVRNQGALPKAGSLPGEGRQRRVRANPPAPFGRTAKDPFAALQSL
ncbi:prenyltransferase [Guyparkeria halophila]|uniref:Prenyltransferase n=1 Tax=Guyparkeria halophila TaxID=47960 RepID=A0ABZ0YWQ8_9GAMM|nr:prenyltransferase [Guyparkeria halophila]WQH15829.1 prenyltransferase [Guyparkeria halophila]